MKKTFAILSCVSISFCYAGSGVNYADSTPVPVPTVSAKQDSTNNIYVGAGISGISSATSINFFKEKALQDRNGAFLLVAGYEYNPYLSVELRFLKTFVEEYAFKQTAYGIYIKPQYEIYNNLKIYGLLGYGKLKVTKHNKKGANFSNTTFHLGAGLSYKITDKFEGYVDYVSYSRDKKVVNYYLEPMKKVDTASVNVGINYHF